MNRFSGDIVFLCEPQQGDQQIGIGDEANHEGSGDKIRARAREHGEKAERRDHHDEEFEPAVTETAAPA